MANKRGWWKLDVAELEGDEDTPPIELNNADREHIAELIQEGYIEGEIVKDDFDDLELE